jgi:Protein of unknwon function (DUF3310)
MHDLCTFCGAWVSFPCETPCEHKECNKLYQLPKGPEELPPMTVQSGWPDTPSPLPDHVNHPQHYARWKMEPIEFIAINDLPWWLANVIKYTMRYDAKDGLRDLYKACSYLNMKIREVEGHPRFWDKPVAEERSAAAELNDHNRIP